METSRIRNETSLIVASESFENEIKHTEMSLLHVEADYDNAETTSMRIRKRDRLRAHLKKMRHNQWVGMVAFFVVGLIFNGLAYLASVYSAQLNAEIIETVIANQQGIINGTSINLRIKKALQGTPSKFLIGLINWIGRLFSAFGTMMLVQSIITFLKRRRANAWVTKAATNTDINDPINDINGGASEMLGEWCLQCFTFGGG
uniref:Ion_trans_2 domain-containing protein n=1 Tax=Rhabditophanes sp. KR3021 TaxID=114890 RepID=A0AC35U6J7_9BILA